MQIIAFLVLLVVFGALMLIDKEAIEPRIKWSLMAVLGVLILLAIAYESTVSQTQEEHRQLINHFQQGEALICDDRKVTIEEFVYENGTASFVAKKEILPLRGVVVPLKNCEVAAE
jgi:hypothetical protein